MTEKTIDLDQHRGMAAQKSTELRRLLANVEADQKALRFGKPNWNLTCWRRRRQIGTKLPNKARYLLNLFAATLDAQDPRRQKLIAAVIADFDRLADQG
jgi:hypothetical protein